jgi:transcriptional regulator with XRE-family HTH domain
MDEKLRLALGDAARAARLRLGLTQAEVSKKVRLKPGVYGRVERGAMVPSVPTLRRICETLSVTEHAG